MSKRDNTQMIRTDRHVDRVSEEEIINAESQHTSDMPYALSESLSQSSRQEKHEPNHKLSERQIAGRHGRQSRSSRLDGHRPRVKLGRVFQNFQSNLDRVTREREKHRLEDLKKRAIELKARRKDKNFEKEDDEATKELDYDDDAFDIDAMDEVNEDVEEKARVLEYEKELLRASYFCTVQEPVILWKPGALSEEQSEKLEAQRQLVREQFNIDN